MQTSNPVHIEKVAQSQITKTNMSTEETGSLSLSGGSGGSWFSWKHVSENQIANLSASFDPSVCKKLLGTYLKLMNGEFADSPKSSSTSNVVEKAHSKQDEVIIDFFFYSYSFCKDLGLCSIKVSTFLSIMKHLLSTDTQNPSSPVSQTQSNENFNHLLLTHSIDNSPTHIRIFTRTEVIAIQAFVTDHYYRHYELYQYLLCRRRQIIFEQRSCTEVEVVVGKRGSSFALGEAEEREVVVTFPVVVEEEEDGEMEEEVI